MNSYNFKKIHIKDSNAKMLYLSDFELSEVDARCSPKNNSAFIKTIGLSMKK